MAYPERSIAFLKDPSVRCHACGSDAPMAARFCRRCGRKLTADADGERDGDPHRAEHKQVTVLFADVQGSMTLSEQLDPEEWYRIVTRFFVIMAEGVQRVGGVVNRFTGDGIMALFGAPVAQEDHAQRACYAALRLRSSLERYSSELRETRGIDLAVRIGIHSGDVVAGTLGRQGTGGYTALGPTVHVASEMERIAAPGRIFVSEHTASLVEGYFRLADRGEPGRARGVNGRVFELVGAGTFASRLERSRSYGLMQFVGRSREMRALERGLEEARAGRGTVIGVRGEVGVGKSRLCDEFVAQCARDGVGAISWRILSHLRGTPYLSLIMEVRRLFGIGRDDPEAAARRRIAEALQGIGGDAPATAPFFEQLLGVSPEAQPVVDPGLPGRMRLMVGSFIAALGHQRPTVLLIEDLQWIDQASARILELALESVAGTRVLVVLNFRPEYRVPPVPGYTEIALPPLGRRAANELLRQLLGDAPALYGLAQEIRERSNGNPFFMEELVTMLAETGAVLGVRGAYRPGPKRDRAALPSSLQALLESRIDLLAPRDKEVLQTAAVIGRTFTLPLLRRVLSMPREEIDEAIVVLQEGDFITECGPANEATFVFRHPMMQEQAYGIQVKDDLAAAHADVARACIELYAQRLDERASLIAHHWEHAGSYREAALWAQRAATWIGQRNLGDGLRGWRKVFALLERAPSSPEVDELAVLTRCRMLELGARLGMPAREVAQVFDEARAMVTRTGNAHQRALVYIAYSQARAFVGDVVEALDLSRQAVRAAEETQDPRFVVALRTALVFSLKAAGELVEALELADALIADLRRQPHRRLGKQAAQLYLFHAMLSCSMGRPRRAREDLEIAADAAWRGADVEVLSLVYAFAPLVTLMLGEGGSDDCLVKAQRAVELAEDLGTPYGRVFAYWAIGAAHILAGEGKTASRVLNGALLLARDHRVGLASEAGLLSELSCATLMRGDSAVALSLADEAVHLARQGPNPENESVALIARAWVLLNTAGASAAAEIESCLGRVLVLGSTKGVTSFAAMARFHLATLAEQLGDETRCVQELRSARAAFVAMEADGWVERVDRRLHEKAAW